MKETVSHQKAKAIAGEYYSLVKEGSEYLCPDGRFLVWNNYYFYIRGE